MDFDSVIPNLLKSPLAILTGGQPSANLEIGGSQAGESGTAPLKLDQGVLLTNPEDGSFEYDGNHLYFVVGTTRKLIV